MVRWHGQTGGNVKRWQFGKGRRAVSREGGRTKLCCIAPGKRNVSRDSLQQFYISLDCVSWINATI